jgi:SAM-dependent methyltransferase
MKTNTTPPPTISGPFDPRRVRLRRARAASTVSQADFLLSRVIGDGVDRIMAINRTFPLAVDIASHGGLFARQMFSTPGGQEKVGAIVCVEADQRAVTARSSVVAHPEEFPFAPESVSLVTAFLSLHVVNDLPGMFIQAKRALKPDGLFLATLFGGRTLQELRSVLVEAEAEITGGVAPRVMPFIDVQDGARLLQRAGFALPVADTDVVTVRYSTPFALFRDLRAMGETSVLAGAYRPLRRDVLARAVSLYAERFGDEDGKVRATFELVTVTGWAPDESQQKPLRPGSAKARLSDALGTVEQTTGEKAGG